MLIMGQKYVGDMGLIVGDPIFFKDSTDFQVWINQMVIKKMFKAIISFI